MILMLSSYFGISNRKNNKSDGIVNYKMKTIGLQAIAYKNVIFNKRYLSGIIGSKAKINTVIQTVLLKAVRVGCFFNISPEILFRY